MINTGLISFSEKTVIFLAECKSIWSSLPNQFFPHDMILLSNRHRHLTVSTSLKKENCPEPLGVTLVEVQRRKLSPSNGKRKKKSELINQFGLKLAIEAEDG